MGGALSAVLFRHWDPLPERKVYSWEREEDGEEDPIIGDEWKTDASGKDTEAEDR